MGRRVLFGRVQNLSKNILYNKIGASTNKLTYSESHLLLLGGGGNEPNGFKSFLKATNGGDIVVLTGKPYVNQRYTHDLWNMSKEFAIPVDSVETIALLSKQSVDEEFVLNKIKNAEAIFFSGGNQFHYISRIKNSKLHALLKKRVNEGIVLGGTSAGLAIMGEFIFTAREGGVRSSTALRNPKANYISITDGFLGITSLEKVITDTHFSERGREGRLLVFMFRAQSDFNQDRMRGIGIDEHSSLTINSNSQLIASGLGSVQIYESDRMVRTNNGDTLNYSPIKRLKLENDKIYPELNLIDFSNSDLINIVNGQIE